MWNDFLICKDRPIEYVSRKMSIIVIEKKKFKVTCIWIEERNWMKKENIRLILKLWKRINFERIKQYTCEKFETLYMCWLFLYRTLEYYSNLLLSVILLIIRSLSTRSLLNREIVYNYCVTVGRQGYVKHTSYALLFLRTMSKDTERTFEDVSKRIARTKGPSFFFYRLDFRIPYDRFWNLLSLSVSRRKTQLALVSATLRTPDISARFTRLLRLDKKHCAPLYELSWGLLACLLIGNSGSRRGRCTDAKERRYWLISRGSEGMEGKVFFSLSFFLILLGFVCYHWLWWLFRMRLGGLLWVGSYVMYRVFQNY